MRQPAVRSAERSRHGLEAGAGGRPGHRCRPGDRVLRGQAGFVLDHDHRVSDEIRFVQLTPPGSACSDRAGQRARPDAARIGAGPAAGRARHRGGARGAGRAAASTWARSTGSPGARSSTSRTRRQRLGRPGDPARGDREQPRPAAALWAGEHECGGEADRVPVLRALAAHPGSQVRTGRDALVQSVELAVAAEELGVDGAYVRVHHFARQLASPFPLLAAMAARTQPDRDRHRRHRHALREPAVHGRGGRGDRPAQRRPAAARRQPGITGDGAARLGGVRLRAARGQQRRRPGPGQDGAVPRRVCAGRPWSTPTRG